MDNFNTFSLITAKFMFQDCINLLEISPSIFKKITMLNYVNGMFKNCKALKEIKIEDMIITTLLEIDEMFSGCEYLEKVNLTGFYTDKVYNMSNMFAGCKSLSLLDIRNFNTKNILTKESYNNIFKDIADSASFTLIYRVTQTKEISDAINEKWSKINIE